MLKHAVIFLLTLEARLVLRKYKPHIVAVTGSVGKTSAKDAIYTVLARDTHVRKSEKSFNGEIGIPLTILGAPNAWHNPVRWLQNLSDGIFLLLFRSPYPEWLVLEIGADRPGDIKSLASWLTVDVVVITRLPEVPVHVEFFESVEALVEEKSSLIDTLRPGGVLIVYADDDRVSALQQRAALRQAKILTFGVSAAADIRADEFALLFEEGTQQVVGMRARISTHITSGSLFLIGAAGAHTFLSLLVAVAVAQALGKDMSPTLEILQSFAPPPGRMYLIRGIKKTLIIDDTYNSSPAAVTAALDTLAFIAQHTPLKGRTIAVLGGMLELGRQSVKEHRKVGAHAAKNAQLLITVGFRARDIAEGALDAGMSDSAIFQYEDVAVVGNELQNMLTEGDLILVKGSQSMRMERIVEEIMAEPERASELLVRQDKEWKKR